MSQDNDKNFFGAVTVDQFERIMERKNNGWGGRKEPEGKETLMEWATQAVRTSRFKLGNIETAVRLKTMFNHQADLSFTDKLKMKVADLTRSFTACVHPIIAAPIAKGVVYALG